MKERGGPLYVGQQLAYLSPQEYSKAGGGNHSDKNNGHHPGPFQVGNHIQGSNHIALSANTNSLNVGGQMTQVHQRTKKGQHGGAGSGPAVNNDQRNMNLAEMMRSSKIIKQSSFQKKHDGGSLPITSFPPMAPHHMNSDFIKGTQVQKDFQLVAEPLQPKSQTQGLMNNPHLKNQQSTSSHITYSNGSSMPDKQSTSESSGLGGGNHYSQTSSRKNLESCYSTVNSKGGPNNFSDVQQITAAQQQSVMSGVTTQQHLSMMQMQNQQQYSTNRSVAAKAGQMQIFSNDKYSHLTSNNSNQNTKFQSPPKGPNSGKAGVNHQQTSSQQIENMMDLQQMRMRTNSGQNPNMKYTDYLNRFSTSQSIDQTQNIQLKYRDLRNQMLEQDDNSSKFNYNHSDTIGTSSEAPAEILLAPHPQASFNVVKKRWSKHDIVDDRSKLVHMRNRSDLLSLIQNSTTQKRSPVVQKENRASDVAANAGFGLGISGEQMHLEEKSFLKKMGIAGGIVGTTLDGTGASSQRHQGSSRKRQDLSVQARGINRGFRPGIDSQHLAIQPRTRYDYVFVRITEESFEKEFADKVIFTRDPHEQSPSALSFKNKRISHMASNSGNKEDAPIIQHHTPQLHINKGQKALRGSQEFLKDSQPNMFSPIGKNQGGRMEELISIQNLQPDQKAFSQGIASSPKITANSCSIISTNHTHIKVITHQGIIGSFSELSPEQISQHQIALNDCVYDVMTKVQEKGRVVKTTQKKKYILNALNAAHMRVASIFVIVLDNNAQIIADNQDMRATLLSDNSSNSNNFNSTLTKLQNSKALMRGGKKEILMKNQDSITNAKNIRMRNNSTINSKGYESESEVKSTNSTTTSSTMQHFIPTRNFDQNPGSNTTKNSSRSLSQKGTQPRKNFQQKVAIAPAEDMSSFVMQKDGVMKKYPPTKIKIVSPYDLTQLESHKINVSLNNYNQFIMLCFKQKGKINVPAVVKLGKQLGLPITQNMFTDGIIKSREQANMLKEKLIAYLCKVINEENQPENMPDNPAVQEAIIPLNQPIHQYKCFVGKGNNSILIRTLFKTRFWWLLHDKEEIEKVNFMWTQLRKNPIMDAFSCKHEDKKSGLRTGGSSSNSTNMQTPGKLKQKKKMSMQTSSQSLESVSTTGNQAASSTDKKDPKADQAIIAAPQNQISQVLQQLSVKLYNKLEDNFHLSNKKAMFLNIRLYYEAMGNDVFKAVPMTFHVKEGLDDPEFHRFKQFYIKEEEEIKKQKANKNQILAEGEESVEKAPQSIRRNIWIIKPGENTNRGQGITVMKDFDEIKAIIQESTANRKRTCIVQKYIHNPLLINKRKFDIRLYAFLSSVNGNLKAYFYQDGYLRTSCREFTLANLSNRMIHLTNDAVQKNAEDYGKYEAGNKLSYTDFQNYLDKNYGDLNICFERDLLPQMKRLVTDMFRSVYGKIDPKKRINTFEIYGYDFMFDDDFKVYLIEVNTNPCLELGCPLLARLIPTMVENALRLVVDPLFPAPENWSQKKCVVNDICPENRFELIFDERVDGPYLKELMKEKNNIIIEIDEEELSDNELDENECPI